MPVALYNLKPPQVQAIQIVNDPAVLQLIASFVGTGITTAAQLRAVLGMNTQFGDWVVHEVGSIGFRVMTNAEFTAQYVLAT